MVLSLSDLEKSLPRYGHRTERKAEDIELNVCKTKHLTNLRSSSADDALKLVPPKILSLEQAIGFIDQDRASWRGNTLQAFVSVNVSWIPETENVLHSRKELMVGF